MRQRLPATAGYPLHSAEAGEIWPGREFEASAPVPGCELLGAPPVPGGGQAEVAPESAAPAQETPEPPPAPSELPVPPAGGTGPQDALQAQDTSRAPARKPARSKEPRQ